jgi:hypothetical protein
MGRSPALHPLDMLGPAEVVAVLGLLQPPPLAAGLAFFAADGLRAVPLAGGIPGIGGEQLLAMTTRYSDGS